MNSSLGYESCSQAWPTDQLSGTESNVMSDVSDWKTHSAARGETTTKWRLRMAFIVAFFLSLLFGCPPTTELTSLEYVPYAGDLRIDFEKLNVDEANEDDFFSDGDEPYIIVVGFRSTLGVSGSTKVFVLNFQEEKWANGSYDDDETTIPDSMGLVRIDDVLPEFYVLLPDGGVREVFVPASSSCDLSIESRGYCQPPQLAGAIAIAMESDLTPWSMVQDLVAEQADALRSELQRIVENMEIDVVHPRTMVEATLNFQIDVSISFWEAVRLAIGSAADSDDYFGWAAIALLNVNPAVVDAYRPVELANFPNILLGTIPAEGDVTPFSFRFPSTGGGPDGAFYKVSGTITTSAPF